jgi:hypothetical protein
MQTIRFITATLSLSVAALSLSACERSELPTLSSKGQAFKHPVATQNPGNPCALLTKAEVAAALKQPVTEAKFERSPRPNCRYNVGPSISEVVVAVFNDPTAKGAAKGGFDVGKTAQDVNPQLVSGIGDDAYWSASLKTLKVLKGDSYFTVQFLGFGSASLKEIKALAHQVANRLP